LTHFYHPSKVTGTLNPKHFAQPQQQISTNNSIKSHYQLHRVKLLCPLLKKFNNPKQKNEENNKKQKQQHFS
jgi:hypothetical protein